MADIIIDSDSGKFKAGDDLDLEIYNNGSHSYIANATATQSIVLRTRASGGSTADAVTIDTDKNVTIEGNLTVNKAITFNETSAAADFRVESDDNTHMLFVDGSEDRVGIASDSPTGILEIKDATGDSDDVTNFAKAVHILADDGSINNSGDIVGMLCFSGRNSGGAGKPVGIIQGMSNSTWNETQPHGWGGLDFKVGSGANLIDRMTMNATGVGIGCTPGHELHLCSATADNPVLKIENTTGHATNLTNHGILEFKSTDTNGSINDNNVLGEIQFMGHHKDSPFTEYLYSKIEGVAYDPGNAYGDLRFFTRTSTSAITEHMRISHQGYVGIGEAATEGAQSLLHVRSTNAAGNIDLIRIDNDAGNTNTEAGILFETGQLSMARISAMNQGSDLGSLKFYVASSSDTLTERMRLDSIGTLYLKTANADEKMRLEGSTAPYIRWCETAANKAYIQWNPSGFLEIHNQEHAEYLAVSDNGVGIGVYAATAKLQVDGAAGATTILFRNADASYASDMQLNRATGRSGSNDFKFLHCYTDGDSESQHQLTGNGDTHNRSGTFSAADYAEYFESKDGKVIAVGTTVKLDGDKIVACEDGDTPLGVIRPTGLSIVGNAAWSHWQDKYLMDDYGSPVMEEYTVTEWIDGKNEDGSNNDIQYYTDKIPSDVTVPSDAIVTSTEKDGRKLMRKKLNPDFVENVDEDGFQIYSSREERDEWHIVGLLGQIPVTKGQPTSSNWIKMKDISDTVEMYIVK